jgi:flagellar biosynthetic protein FlhB
VPQSQELMSIVTLLVLVAMVALLGPSLLQWFVTQVVDGMSGEKTVFAGSKSFLDFASRKTVDLILIICPILAALFAGAVLAGVAISGLNFAPGAINLKFSQLNPVAGLGRLVNAQSMVKRC